MRSLEDILLTPAHVRNKYLWFLKQCAVFAAKDITAIPDDIKYPGSCIKVTNSMFFKAMTHEQDKSHVNITILRATGEGS